MLVSAIPVMAKAAFINFSFSQLKSGSINNFTHVLHKKGEKI